MVLALLVVGAAVALVIWWRARAREVDRGFPYDLRLGTTTVGEGLPEAGRSHLLAYLNTAASTIYVSAGSAERVRARIGAVTEADGSWTVALREGIRRFQVSGLEELAPAQRFGRGDLLVMNRADCHVIRKGTCVRRVTQGGAFLYSYLAPDDLARCLTDPVEVCAYELLELTVQTFSDKNCQVSAGQKKDTFAHCHPA